MVYATQPAGSGIALGLYRGLLDRDRRPPRASLRFNILCSLLNQGKRPSSVRRRLQTVASHRAWADTSTALFYDGKIISMTGGHGDFRQMGEGRHTSGYCSCGTSNSICVIADGVDAVIAATRDGYLNRTG
jgi:hypothetical protein